MLRKHTNNQTNNHAKKLTFNFRNPNKMYIITAQKFIIFYSVLFTLDLGDFIIFRFE